MRVREVGDGRGSVEGPGPRFTLYDEAGAFGVYDSHGPQVFFAETRERAAAEVQRANAVVATYPTTVSMRHLREMDGAWRAARGLPLLPEPAGHRVVVDARVGARAGAPPGGPDRPTDAGATASTDVSPLARALEAAASVRAHAQARATVGERTAAVRNTRRVLGALDRAADAAEVPMSAFRHALREVYGERSVVAEEAFALLVRERGPAGAAASVADDPRGLVPARERFRGPGTLADCERLAREAGAAGEVTRRIQRAVDAAAGHLASLGLGAPTGVGVLEIRDRVVEVLAVQERSAAEARSAQAPRDDVGHAITSLRQAWKELLPGEREAVQVAFPDVQTLVRPARGRGGPDRGGTHRR